MAKTKTQQHNSKTDEDPQPVKQCNEKPYDQRLFNIQTKAFLVLIFGVLSISLVHRFLPILYPLELAVMAIAGIIALGIGGIWLHRDFHEFKEGYLQYLDKKEAQEHDQEKAKAMKKVMKQRRKHHGK